MVMVLLIVRIVIVKDLVVGGTRNDQPPADSFLLILEK